MNRKDLNVIVDCCAREFSRRGFVVPARGRVLYPLNEGVLGWVGLNQFNQDDAVVLYPFVGLHHQPIMQLVALVQNYKYVRGATATYAVPFQSIAPHASSFRFTLGDEMSSQAAEMTEQIAQSAIPYMQDIAPLQQLLHLMKERESMLGGYPERIAAALYLDGAYEDLAAYVLERRNEYAKDLVNPDVAVRWDQFSASLDALHHVRANNSFKPTPLRGAA